MDFQTIKEMNPNGINLSNAFSINMLADSTKLCNLRFKKITKETAQFVVDELGFISHIGHADTAKEVSKELGIEVPAIRDTYTFTSHLLVAQYTGKRLDEGTTALPDGSNIVWWLVEDNAIYA